MVKVKEQKNPKVEDVLEWQVIDEDIFTAERD